MFFWGYCTLLLRAVALAQYYITHSCAALLYENFHLKLHHIPLRCSKVQLLPHGVASHTTTLLLRVDVPTWDYITCCSTLQRCFHLGFEILALLQLLYVARQG